MFEMLVTELTSASGTNILKNGTMIKICHQHISVMISRQNHVVSITSPTSLTRRLSRLRILTLISETLDLSAFATVKTVYSINSSKFDILTGDGTETVALDEAIKSARPNIEAIHNFTRANVPYGYISSYRYAHFRQFTRPFDPV